MTIDEAVRTVLRGFDEGVFVRSIDRDNDPAWAIKLFPFIRALGVLSQSVEEPASVAAVDPVAAIHPSGPRASGSESAAVTPEGRQDFAREWEYVRTQGDGVTQTVDRFVKRLLAEGRQAPETPKP